MTQCRQYHYSSENRYNRPLQVQNDLCERSSDVSRSVSRRVQVRWRRNVLTSVKVVLVPVR